MPTQTPVSSVIRRSAIALASFFLLTNGSRAQTPAPAAGAIQGRVINPSNDQYVGNTRLTIEGTPLETFSDADGHYRLAPVSAGTVRVTAFYTGLQPRTETVSVAAGQVVQLDFKLFASARVQPDSGSEPIALPRFAVTASREIEGAALAIHEQRFAPNMKHIVSTDEFGYVAESNVAEFLKFLPGVAIDYQAGNARYVTLNGVGAASVPVAINGLTLASATAEDPTTRSVQLDMVSLNNLSRVEIAFTPTPESPGSALSGSVNLVPRSSFERVRPSINASLSMTMRDNARDFHAVPGPRRFPTTNVHPGGDFSAIVPVNRDLGFTLSGSLSSTYSALGSTTPTWRGTGLSTDGVLFPHTTPDRPYLTSYAIFDSPRVQTRRSLGTTLDFRPARNDRISLGLQYSSFDAWFRESSVTFSILRVLPGGQFTTTSTRSAPGGGTLLLRASERNRFNQTLTPSVSWRHDGPIWKIEAAAQQSQQADRLRDGEIGAYRFLSSERSNVTIAFDDVVYLRPRQITVTDGSTGAPVNPYAIATYALNSASNFRAATDVTERSAYANVRRDFSAPIPYSLKAGVDLRQSVHEARSSQPSYVFLGRDGRRSNTPIGSDDSAARFLDANFSQRILPFGFPRTDAVSSHEVWTFHQQNPAQISQITNTTYRNEVSGSKHSDEVVSAAFLRGDVALFARRLKLVGGLRAEQTNVQAEGPLTDVSRDYRRDAAGNILRNPNGTPVLIVPTNAGLAYSQLTFIERGTHVRKERLDVFPSLNASYNVRENLVLRGAYYQSIGRPSFNQYAGGLTLPDPTVATSRITVNNPALKPWTAKSTVAKLDYYFAGVGQVSLGAFQRDFRNSFSNGIFAATPQFLDFYGLDQTTYQDSLVSSQVNVPGVVRMTGVDFSYNQVLTFLPHWARGIRVVLNGSTQRATGPNRDSFAGSNYVPRTASCGFSLTREKFTLRANGMYRSQQRRAVVAAGPSIAPGTHRWVPRQARLDLSGEYRLNRKLALFADLRDVTDTPETTEIAGPLTPPHARLSNRIAMGSLWTFGIKGSF